MLTFAQITAIIMLLQAFGVDAGTVAAVQADLSPKTATVASAVPTGRIEAPGPSQTTTEPPLEIYELEWQSPGTIYYRGSAPLKAFSALTDKQTGNTVALTTTRYDRDIPTTSCVVIDSPTHYGTSLNISDQDRLDLSHITRCGGSAQELTPATQLPVGRSYSLTLTLEDGSTHTEDVRVTD